MDKLSLQVLKYISKSNGEAEQESIVEQFGENSLRSLTYLEKENFIKSGRLPAGGGVFVSDGLFAYEKTIHTQPNGEGVCFALSAQAGP